MPRDNETDTPNHNPQADTVDNIVDLLAGGSDYEDDEDTDEFPEHFMLPEEKGAYHERQAEDESIATEQSTDAESQEGELGYEGGEQGETQAGLSEQGTGNAKPIDPRQMVSPEALKAGYQELQSTMQQLQTMYQNNEISGEQFQQAEANAGQYAMKLREQSVNLREQQLNYGAQIEGYHKEIAKMIPAWGNEKKRANIQSDMTQWAHDEFGMSPADVEAWGKRANPVEVKMAFDSFRMSRQGSFEQQQKIKASAQRAKQKAKQKSKPAPEPEYRRGDGGFRQANASENVDAIARLLMDG